MRINKFAVEQLFGLYDYDISFWDDENISILHGPNGCGKTTILRLMDAIIGCKIEIIDKIPFKKVEITINDTDEIIVEKDDVFYSYFSQDAETYFDNQNIDVDIEMPFTYSIINGIDEDCFRVTINIEDLFNEIEGAKEGGIFIDIPEPQGKLLGQAICIKEIRNELGIWPIDEHLYEALLDYQLETMMDYSTNVGTNSVLDCVTSLKGSHNRENISWLLYLLNDRVGFYNAEFRYDEKKGLTAVTKLGKELPLELLSSGEKNLFRLFYKLIFSFQDDSVVLIDEPELSLHIAWQREYINILEEVCKRKNIQAVIATHSPNIVDEHYDLLVDIVKENYS